MVRGTLLGTVGTLEVHYENGLLVLVYIDNSLRGTEVH